MLLCIDIGNTNLVFGLWHENKWQGNWRVRTVPEKMSDEYAILFKSMLTDRGFALEDVHRAAIASVVPRLKTIFLNLFDRYLGIEPLIIGPGVKTGMSIRIDNPAELGADLVADAVAAYQRVKGACIIVDFGTATTFSAISGKGEFLGVAIAPGIEVASDALSTRTAQLPRVRLVPPSQAIGTNTVHSMQSGLIFGYIGLVERMIQGIREELDEKAVVIATGGSSNIIAPLTDKIDIIDQVLTLNGLRLISEHNS